MHELPGRSWLEGSDRTRLLGVGPPRDWGRGDRRRQRGTARDPRRRAWRRARVRGDACETGGVGRAVGGPGPGGARRTPRGPGGGSRCPTRHSAPPLAPPPPASLMGDEPRDSRPFGRDVTVQNARRAPGSKPSCFVSEVVAAARGRSPRLTYCQAVLVAVQVMEGLCVLQMRKVGQKHWKTSRGLPVSQWQSWDWGSAPRGPRSCPQPLSIPGCRDPRGQLPGRQAPGLPSARVGGGRSRRTVGAAGPASPPPCELCGHLARTVPGPLDARGPQPGLFALHACPAVLSDVCEPPGLGEAAVAAEAQSSSAPRPPESRG